MQEPSNVRGIGFLEVRVYCAINVIFWGNQIARVWGGGGGGILYDNGYDNRGNGKPNIVASASD